jgi:hypothetical protein
MVNYSALIFIIFPFFSFAQELPGYEPNWGRRDRQTETPQFFTPRLLKASATISPGIMLNNHASSINLSGFLEYIIEDAYSLRGDVFQFIDANYTTKSLIEPVFQNRLFFGAFKHFGKNNLKLYSGLQMGTTITTYNQSWFAGNRTYVSPSFAVKSGISYYVWKYFNFFADFTYVNSILRGTSFGSHRMDELIFSSGLGFQVPLKKKRSESIWTGTLDF